MPVKVPVPGPSLGRSIEDALFSTSFPKNHTPCRLSISPSSESSPLPRQPRTPRAILLPTSRDRAHRDAPTTPRSHPPWRTCPPRWPPLTSTTSGNMPSPSETPSPSSSTAIPSSCSSSSWSPSPYAASPPPNQIPTSINLPPPALEASRCPRPIPPATSSRRLPTTMSHTRRSFYSHGCLCSPPPLLSAMPP